MPNPNGNPSALVPAPLGNKRGEKHGLYAARREVTPESRFEFASKLSGGSLGEEIQRRIAERRAEAEERSSSDGA